MAIRTVQPAPDTLNIDPNLTASQARWVLNVAYAPGAAPVRTFPLQAPVVLVSRATTRHLEAPAILLPDDAVSRQGVRLVSAGADYELRVEGGTNPVYLNGAEAPASSLLRLNDVIRIGRTVLVVDRYVAPARGNEQLLAPLHERLGMGISAQARTFAARVRMALFSADVVWITSSVDAEAMVTLEWMIESVGLPATHVALGSPDAESALLDAPVTDSVVVHGFGDAGDAAIAAATDLLRQRRHVARDGRILVACGSEDLARRPVVLMRDRLEVLELRVPPLRERRADICDALLRFATRPGCLLTHQTADAATRYDWPGGVPELMRVARRLALVQGPIEPFELPEAAAVLALSSPQSVERVRIRESFETHQGNASRVAESLGMSRNHLYRRMRELGLSPESLRLETKKPRAKAPRRAKAGP